MHARADGTEAVAAVAVAVAPNPPPEAAPAPELPTTSPREMKIGALVAGGVAVAAAAGGVTFGVLALDDKSRFEDAVNGTKKLGTPEAAQMANTASEYAVLADVCFGAAVVAAVTSIVLFVRSGASRSDADKTEPKAAGGMSFTLSPLFSPRGGGAGATLRF